MTSTFAIEPDSDVWVPPPEIKLASCYHPDLHTGHAAYGQLPMSAQLVLDRLEQQASKWGHKPYFKGGVENTRIAILNGYHKSARLLNCMMVPSIYNRSQPYGRCSLATFCPFCAYLRGQDMLKKYGPSWKPGCWYRLVFSLRGFVNLSSGSSMLDVWETMRACVRRWAPSVDGCLGWEELAVSSFWPEVKCTPHLNLLVQNAEAPDLRLLAQIIAEEWQAAGLSVFPDPKIDPVGSEAHFFELLDYVKPIDLLTPYNSGFLAAKITGELEFFHQEIRSFFEAYAVYMTQYQQRWDHVQCMYVQRPVTRIPYFYNGTCHGSARNKIGVKISVRRTKAHQERIRAKVLNAREDEMDQRYNQASQAEDCHE